MIDEEQHITKLNVGEEIKSTIGLRNWEKLFPSAILILIVVMEMAAVEKEKLITKLK